MRNLLVTSMYSAVFVTLFASGLVADDVRIVQENGVTYQETTRIVRSPVTSVTTETRELTTYKERLRTAVRESVQTYYVPKSEHHYEARWHNWWNPFAEPQLVYHPVPHTRWQPRTEKIRTAVTVREFIPETRTIRVPVRQLGFSPRQETHRVVVALPSRMTPQRPVERRQPEAIVRQGSVNSIEQPIVIKRPSPTTSRYEGGISAVSRGISGDRLLPTILR